jgi:hypothetical protein
MAVSLYVHIFTFLSIIIDGLIIYLILRKREQANLRMNWYLIFTIISIILWIISVYLQESVFPFFPDENIDNLWEFSLLAAFSNIVIGLGLLFISVFIKYLVQPELDFRQTSYIISLVVLIAGLYFVIIVGAYLEDVDVVKLTFNIANLINLVLLISVLIFTRNDIKVLREGIEEHRDTVKKQISLLNWGLHLALVGIIPLLIIANFVEREAISLSFFLMTIALMLIAYAYLIDPRVVYILPERVYQAIVVNHSGVLRYSVQFTGETDDSSSVLISGALNAITALMSEFYETTVHPNMIKFEERLILFKWSEDYYLSVFSDRDSKLIREAMDTVVREIERKYGSEINKYMNQAEILKLDDTFHKAFYFVYDT